MIDKTALLADLAARREELQTITAITPTSYEEYNAMRLRYDTCLTKIETLRSQLALNQMEQELTIE